MSDSSKVAEQHRRRRTWCMCQSTPTQLERNHESRARQDALRHRAIELGWPEASVSVVDEDLGRSGASADGRLGFKDLVAKVRLGQVGLILALETSRRVPQRTGMSCWICGADRGADRRPGRHLLARTSMAGCCCSAWRARCQGRAASDPRPAGWRPRPTRHKLAVGSVDLTADSHPIDIEGLPQLRISMFGVLTEGVRHFTQYIPSPRSRMRAFEDVGACVAEILGDARMPARLAA
jgi:hypothetical protein